MFWNRGMYPPLWAGYKKLSKPVLIKIMPWKLKDLVLFFSLYYITHTWRLPSTLNAFIQTTLLNTIKIPKYTDRTMFLLLQVVNASSFRECTERKKASSRVPTFRSRIRRISIVCFTPSSEVPTRLSNSLFPISTCTRPKPSE